jgi:hypothetical protein
VQLNRLLSDPKKIAAILDMYRNFFALLFVAQALLPVQMFGPHVPGWTAALGGEFSRKCDLLQP